MPAFAKIRAISPGPPLSRPIRIQSGGNSSAAACAISLAVVNSAGAE
jgi:hypothetical protein